MNQLGLLDRIKNLKETFKDKSDLIEKSPLFIHSYMEEECKKRSEEGNRNGADAFKKMIKEGLPFNLFRYILKLKGEGFNYPISGFVAKDESGCMIVFFPKSYDVLSTFSLDANGIPNDQFYVETYKDGKLSQGDETAKSLCHIAYSTLHTFLEDVNSPHNFMVNVSPESKGRSIEWSRAREHLILIDKRHPINNKDSKHITLFDMKNNNEIIKRMAHSRRAHHRILRSPKFKNKIGQRIFIKSMWVGPKEWKDSIGNIYKIKV